jgi:CheY-like chemotaxis protein
MIDVCCQERIRRAANSQGSSGAKSLPGVPSRTSLRSWRGQFCTDQRARIGLAEENDGPLSSEKAERKFDGMVATRHLRREGAIVPRILVVDDDPLVSQSIQLWLERRGMEVVVADDGITGLNALDKSTFDLMIIDIFMPHMRGFESIRVFHQSAPSVPLIAISGYDFAQLNSPAPDFLRMALELGASRCLRKPFTPATLLTMVDECLEEAQRPHRH